MNPENNNKNTSAHDGNFSNILSKLSGADFKLSCNNTITNSYSNISFPSFSNCNHNSGEDGRNSIDLFVSQIVVERTNMSTLRSPSKDEIVENDRKRGTESPVLSRKYSRISPRKDKIARVFTSSPMLGKRVEQFSDQAVDEEIVSISDDESLNVSVVTQQKVGEVVIHGVANNSVTVDANPKINIQKDQTINPPIDACILHQLLSETTPILPPIAKCSSLDAIPLPTKTSIPPAIACCTVSSKVNIVPSTSKCVVDVDGVVSPKNIFFPDLQSAIGNKVGTISAQHKMFRLKIKSMVKRELETLSGVVANYKSVSSALPNVPNREIANEIIFFTESISYLENMLKLPDS